MSDDNPLSSTETFLAANYASQTDNASGIEDNLLCSVHKWHHPCTKIRLNYNDTDMLYACTQTGH